MTATRTGMRVDTRIALAQLMHGSGAPQMSDWLPKWTGPLVADDDPALPPFRYDETVVAVGWDPLHVCPSHRENCAGVECCCGEYHRGAPLLQRPATRDAS